jgi:hypothetical protein
MSETSDNEAIEEINEEPLTKPKVKKPRSQAQIEAFEKVKERRKQNLEVKKQEKLLNSAKLLLEEEKKNKSKPSKPNNSNRVKYQKVPQVEPESECESESEEEVIVVKKKKPVKKPKKVRKIIIEESSSDEEEDEEEEPRNYNRNSKVKIIRQTDPLSFFC